MKTSVENIDAYALKKDIGSSHKSETFSKVGIVGCGNLGQEVARMVSNHGVDVTFLELSITKI
ncbi:MAG: hypothetical protein KFF73_05545, partial [Cyclobacteriaceae bacterium]|nr:hypothetical protein [Cyclobacteriaceae bacterium]